MKGNFLIDLNGTEVWGYVVEQDDGLRVRVALDDWQRLGFFEGRRVSLKLPRTEEALLFITRVAESPPLVWVTLAKRIRVAG